MLPEAAPVLLVDDNLDDRFILAQCWRRAGIRNPIIEVEDGQRAIDYLSAASTGGPGAPLAPRLVLLDLKMPVLNGFELLQWLRADDVWRRIPVIVMTASDQQADVERAYALGANSYVVKPSSVQVLVELLRSLKEYWFRFSELPGG